MRQLLVVASLALAGCRGCEESSPRTPPSVTEGDRYWLARADLAIPGHGTRRIDLATPRLVVLRDGEVVDPDEPGWRGSWSWPERPEAGRGLMLYAQRRVTLLTKRGGEPSDSTLLPGALVSVVPTEGGYLVAPGPPAHGLGFAEEGALGAAEPAHVEAPREPALRATRCGYDAFGAWNPMTCIPMLMGPEPDAIMQRVGRIERRGPIADEYARVWCYEEPLLPVAWWCTVSSISRDASGFRIWSVELEPNEQAIEEVPAGYAPVVSPSSTPAPLREPGGTLHVLAWSEAEVACAPIEVDAEPTDGGTTGTLRVDGGSLAFRYDEARGELTIPLGSAFRGLPEVARVVVSTDEELHVLRRAIRSDALFYRETDAERWFTSRAACERAATGVRTRLSESEEYLLTVGLHAPFLVRRIDP